MRILDVEVMDRGNKSKRIDFVDHLIESVTPCVLVGPNGSWKTRMLDAVYSVFYNTSEYAAFNLRGVSSVKAIVEINGVNLGVTIQYPSDGGSPVSSIQRTISASLLRELIDEDESNLDYFPHYGNNVAPVNYINGVRKVFITRTYSEESNGEANYAAICNELDTTGSNDVVLLDCPENYGLDAANQRMLVHRLIKMGRSGTQVIIASNSTEIIKCFRGDSVKFMG